MLAVDDAFRRAVRAGQALAQKHSDHELLGLIFGDSENPNYGEIIRIFWRRFGPSANLDTAEGQTEFWTNYANALERAAGEMHEKNDLAA